MKIAALLLILAAAAYCVELALPKHDYFVERVGAIESVEHVESTDDRGIRDAVHLVSSTGLEVDLRVRRPVTASGEKLPLVILLGGHRTGKDAVDLVGVPNGIAYAAIDYPGATGLSADGVWQSLRIIPKVQRAFLDAPPGLLLALSWALRQPWVDERRIELVGASLGVPFAAVAGAVDARFTRVWLLHGGARNLDWVDYAGRRRIENDALRRLVARAALFLVHGNSFDTEKWIREIAPRPLILVAACNDDYVPRAAQVPFVDAAAGEFVELIWTDGLHIDPDRQDVLNQLLAVVTDRVRGGVSTLSVTCEDDRFR